MPVETSGFHTNKPIEEDQKDFIFLKKGATHLRVLPAYSDRGRWFREVKEVWLTVDGKKKPIVSPATNGDPCPFEEEGRRLYELKGEENIKRAREFRPRRSYLFNVVVKDTPDGAPKIDNCVKILKCGVKTFRQILDHDQDHAGGWGDITNLEKGYDLRITRTGQGRMDTEYTVKGVPNQQSRSILDYLDTNGYGRSLVPHDLDVTFTPASYEEMQEYLEIFKTELDNAYDENPNSTPEFQNIVKSDEVAPQAPIESENTDIPAPPIPVEG